MTMFIPEWTSSSGAALGLHRVLRQLGEQASVRTPLGGEHCPADYLIEHDEYGWLALSVCHAHFDEIDPKQLFPGEARSGFTAQVAALAALSPATLPRLMLLWNCDDDEAVALSGQDGAGSGITFWSREHFSDGGAGALHALMRQLQHQQVLDMRRRYVPQSEIQGLRAGRRSFHRNNSALLTGFFLDREQEWASKLDLDLGEPAVDLARDFSVRLLNGVAGSGKTLIALQRARLLAQLRPADQVLLLIHNQPVVADLNERLQRSAFPLPPNMKICTFAKWAHQQWRALFGRFPLIAPDREVLLLIAALRGGFPGLRQSDQELFEELKFMNDALIADRGAYLAADRTGRRFALREQERADAWALREQLNDELGATNMRLWSDIPRELVQSNLNGRLPLLDHILIDEAQFMSPAALQLVKLALRPKGSLFLCADPRQGFLKSRLSWKSVGLDVAGRTKKLRRSYRTTAALLRAATMVLASVVDDDPEEFLAPDYSHMEAGVPPVLLTTGSQQDAIDRVVSEVSALARSKDLSLSTVTVIYGDSISRQLLYAALCRQVGEARIWWMNKDREGPHHREGEHIRMVNIDTATGLEGTFVFLLGVDGLLDSVTRAEHSRDAEEHARKLYMAMTRSCYRLCVVAGKPLPPGPLADLFEHR